MTSLWRYNIVIEPTVKPLIAALLNFFNQPYHFPIIINAPGKKLPEDSFKEISIFARDFSDYISFLDMDTTFGIEWIENGIVLFC